MRHRISLLLAVCVPLLVLGCSQPEPVASTAPPPDPANQAAVNARIEQLKKENPNMPPTALGTRAAQEMQAQQRQQQTQQAPSNSAP